MKAHHLPALVAAVIAFAGCDRGQVEERAGRAADKSAEVVQKVGSKTGKAIGESVSSFLTGVGEGIDSAVTRYDIRLSDELKAEGVQVTVAQHVSERSFTSTNVLNGLNIYVINTNPVVGTMRIKLFNAEKQEIGRSVAKVDLPADSARYVLFPLEKAVPINLVRYIELGKKGE